MMIDKHYYFFFPTTERDNKKKIVPPLKHAKRIEPQRQKVHKEALLHAYVLLCVPHRGIVLLWFKIL